MNPIEAEPGVYRHMPAGSYHAIDAASASRLNTLRHRSPLHMRHEADHPPEPTPAMVFGEGCHTFVLQPELFAKRYVVAGPCSAAKKDGNPCENAGKVIDGGRWYCGVHGKGKGGGDDRRTALTLDDQSRLIGIRAAVLGNPWASALLVARTDTELSLVWDDAETGVRCKGRMDGFCRSHRLVLDLKTTEDASREAFRRSIFTRGYDLQGAQYLAGCEALNLDADGYCLIVVEKEPPYAVAVYRLSDHNLAAAREQRLDLLREYGRCRDTNHWPGYGESIEDIEVPGWALKQIEDAAA